MKMFNDKLTIREYEMRSPIVKSRTYIMLLSDLHSETFDYDVKELKSLISPLSPDIVLIAGDIYDKEEGHDNVASFLKYLGSNYETYAVIGNHEIGTYRKRMDERIKSVQEELGNLGIILLNNMSISTHNLFIFGINDINTFKCKTDYLDMILSREDNINDYSILLTHKPNFFEDYLGSKFDLTLCGHTHGGQFRIPGILNGLYVPNQGFFPKYAGGYYEVSGKEMIISRGMTTKNTSVPRIYNPPEIVLINLNKERPGV